MALTDTPSILNLATPDLRICSRAFFFCSLVSLILIASSVTFASLFGFFARGFTDFFAILAQNFESAFLCQAHSPPGTSGTRSAVTELFKSIWQLTHG